MLWLFSQVFLKGRAKRHADINDGRGKKTKPVADFCMEGNRTVTYGKIEHVVGHLLLQLPLQSVKPACKLVLLLYLAEPVERWTTAFYCRRMDTESLLLS